MSTAGSIQGQTHARAPTTNNWIGMFSQLQEHIPTLEARQSVPSVKAGPPEPCNDTRSKFRSFLTRLDMCNSMNGDRSSLEADKVPFASTYLSGPAFVWFEPYIQDFNERSDDQQDEDTRAVVARYPEFKNRLSDDFGHIDSVRSPERKLRRLRQTGSAEAYASDFQRTILHLDWDEDTSISIFEAGLKPEVQEKLLMWQERPDNLKDMIAAAVKADNQLYEFNFEGREQFQHWHGNLDRKNDRYQPSDWRPAHPHVQGYEDSYRPRPTEFDATQEVPKEEQRRRKEKNLCFNCGKPGHRRNNCKVRRPGQRPMRQISATDEQGGYHTTGVCNPVKQKDTGTHKKLAGGANMQESEEDDLNAYNKELESRKMLGWASDDGNIGPPISGKDEPDQWGSTEPLDEQNGTQVKGLEASREEPNVQIRNEENREKSSCVNKIQGGCPCNKLMCSCIGYQRHPEHKSMHFLACYEDECMTHYDAKLNNGRFPRKPRGERQPQWRK